MRRGLLLLAVLLGAAHLVGVSMSLEPPMVYAKDFGQEYLLARALWDGLDTNLPIRVLAMHYLGGIVGYFDKPIPTPHPPTAGLLLLPIAALDYVAAARVWFVAELVGLTASVLLLARAAGLPTRWVSIATASTALVAWPPLALELTLGQLTVALLLLLAGAQAALASKRPLVGGALVGLSLLAKPLAWPWLVVFVRRREWSVLGMTVATVLVGYAIVAVRQGPDRLSAYLFTLMPTLVQGYAPEPTNISLWTVGPRLVPDGPALAQAISLGLVGAVLVCLWLWVGPRSSLGPSLGLATAVAILVSPISWQFYLVLALLPIGHVFGSIRARGYPLPLVCVALFVAVLLSIDQSTWYTLVRATRGAAVAWLLPSLAVVSLAAVLRGTMREQSTRGEEAAMST